MDGPALRIEWAGSADSDKLSAWDEFLRASPRGHYCQLSTWLRSFGPYGFSCEVLLAREPIGNRIIGGAGMLRFGSRLFSIAIVPMGPIVDLGYEEAATGLVQLLAERSRETGDAFLQLQLPCPEQNGEMLPAALLPPLALGSELHPIAERLSSVGTAPPQMLWIEFGQDSGEEIWREHLLARFSENTRRNVRVSERSGLELIEASSADLLRRGYRLIELNGQQQGYGTRSWRDFGPTVLEQVRRCEAVMLIARHQGRDLGCHYGIMAGQRYSYLMGGTLRLETDFRVGHFLHWNAMIRARALGMLGYDFTSGGSAGVMRFKLGFRPQYIRLRPPCHFVFSPTRVRLFRWLYPRFRTHRRILAEVLSRFRRLVSRAEV